MFGTIIAESFAGVLATYATCFQARSYPIFQWLVLGWVQCLERRTLTAVALASGAVGVRHISVFHRFFARAHWSLDALGQGVFEQALRWLPAEQPLYLLGDDTLARKSGKCVSLAAMHHDPLLSTARKPFFSFGHVWVVLALWVPLPMGRGRGFALPLLVRLYTGAKRGGRADAPSRPTHGAAPPGRRGRPCRAGSADQAGVAAGAGRHRGRLGPDPAVLPGGGQRLRGARALGAAPAQRAGRESVAPGRRAVGARAQAAPGAEGPAPPPRRAAAYPAAGGRPLSALASADGDDLWADRHHPGPHRARALVRRAARAAGGRSCSSATPRASAATKPSSAPTPRPRRGSSWKPTRAGGALEVTFHDAKQFLGFAEPQCQTPRAVQRTAPFALLVYDLVLLWFAEHAHAAAYPTWSIRPWYRHKTGPILCRYARRSARGAWAPRTFWSQRALYGGPQTRRRPRRIVTAGPPNGGSRD